MYKKAIGAVVYIADILAWKSLGFLSLSLYLYFVGSDLIDKWQYVARFYLMYIGFLSILDDLISAAWKGWKAGRDL